MLRLVRSWKSFYDLLKVKVFLDANVFFAAAGSPTGGSAFVLELAKHKKIQATTVGHALVEAERNIQKKLGEEAELSFQIVTPGDFLQKYIREHEK